jgi:putative FmdB family regulatory protein
MPIYEYQCGNCGHELEVLQKITEAALTDCPECRTSALVKRVSAAGFQLKGSGWYATDFRNNGKSKAKTGTKGGETSTEAKTETKSGETSTETKSDSKDAPSPTPAAGCGGNCACH